ERLLRQRLARTDLVYVGLGVYGAGRAPTEPRRYQQARAAATAIALAVNVLTICPGTRPPFGRENGPYTLPTRPAFSHLTAPIVRPTTRHSRAPRPLSPGQQPAATPPRPPARNPPVPLPHAPTAARDGRSRAAVENPRTHPRDRLSAALIIVTHDPAQARRLS